MRWKLVLIVSIVSALTGAAASLAVAHWLLGSTERLTRLEFAAADFAALSTFLFPLATITFAGIFVYRHTSRRRSLQAMATALLAIMLTLAAFVAATAYRSRSRTPAEPSPTPINNRV